MTSTGNDIVALKAINIARTKQQNFYSKIITTTEKALFAEIFSQGLSFVQFVWLLWSIKESVYKYLQRTDPGLVFSPTKIVLSQLRSPLDIPLSQFEGRDFDDKSVFKGVARFGASDLYSRSVIGEDFIFSVVNHSDNFERVLWGVKKIDSSASEGQSADVRIFTMAMLRGLFPGEKLTISKNAAGIPVLLNDGVETPAALSLAHHDDYVAYSFAIPA